MENPSMSEYSQEIALEQEAQRFTEENTVDAKDGRMCVDGRYLDNGAENGFLARPGADFGYVMGLIGLFREGKINMTIEESVDTVYNYVTKNGNNFFAHTDDHSVKEDTLTGCGHIARSTNPDFSELYGVTPDDSSKAIAYLRDKNQHPNVEEPSLPGDHGEKGVMVVKGKEKTIRHKDKNGNQYFVYDQDRDDEFVDKFVESVGIEGLKSEDLKRVLKKQTDATLQLLAGNKPVFEVNFEKDKKIVKFVNIVKPFEKAA